MADFPCPDRNQRADLRGWQQKRNHVPQPYRVPYPRPIQLYSCTQNLSSHFLSAKTDTQYAATALQRPTPPAPAPTPCPAPTSAFSRALHLLQQQPPLIAHWGRTYFSDVSLHATRPSMCQPQAAGEKNADFWGLTEIEAGSPISLPATEIGWLAPGRRFLRQDYVL